MLSWWICLLAKFQEVLKQYVKIAIRKQMTICVVLCQLNKISCEQHDTADIGFPHNLQGTACTHRFAAREEARCRAARHEITKGAASINFNITDESMHLQ